MLHFLYAWSFSCIAATISCSLIELLTSAVQIHIHVVVIAIPRQNAFSLQYRLTELCRYHTFAECINLK